MKEPNTILSLRLPPELKARIEKIAKATRRSLNSQIIYLLELSLGYHQTESDDYHGEPDYDGTRKEIAIRSEESKRSEN